MEESPHKCPVCSRSFNQRSNLKTHLLTHTDHKPYECSACGKVFRRNCDLRRHALTHTVGDVPAEVLDVGDSEMNLSGDEEDTVLEVDSPVHSPITRTRSPSITDLRPESPAVHDEEDEDDEELHTTFRREEIEPLPARQKDEIVVENNLGTESNEPPAITHCHHDGGQSHYTMRPHPDYNHFMYKDHHRLSAIQYSMGRHQPLNKQSLVQLHQQQQHEPFVPMLHVRRDLHHRDADSMSTIANSALQDGGPPNYLGSIPIRKRTIGLDGEPHPIVRRSFSNPHHMTHPLNLSGCHVPLKPPDELLISSIIPPPSQPPLPPPPPSEPTNHDMAIHQSPAPVIVPPPPPIIMAHASAVGPTNHSTQQHKLHSVTSLSASSPGSQQHQPIIAVPVVVPPPPSVVAAIPPPPRRTGFSIEDIMRR